MTTKEFLSQAFTLDRQIKAKQMQIQRLKDMQYSISGTLSPDKVQTTPSHDRLGDITASIIDLQDEYIKDIARLLVVKHEIKKAIEKVVRNDFKLLLEMRYINLAKIEEIACELNRDYRGIRRKIEKAVKSLEVPPENMI